MTRRAVAMPLLVAEKVVKVDQVAISLASTWMITSLSMPVNARSTPAVGD